MAFFFFFFFFGTVVYVRPKIFIDWFPYFAQKESVLPAENQSDVATSAILMTWQENKIEPGGTSDHLGEFLLIQSKSHFV